MPPIKRLGGGTLSSSGECNRPMMCISVLLPHPDGPMIPTISPCSIRHVDPSQGVDQVMTTQPVGLVEVARLQKGHADASTRI